MEEIPDWFFDGRQTAKVIKDLRRELTEVRSCLKESNEARIARMKPEARTLVPKASPVATHRWLTQWEKMGSTEETP